MGIFLLRKDCIHLRGSFQTLQTTPKGLRSGEVVTFSSQMSPNGAYYKRRFAQGRRLLCCNASFFHIAAKRLRPNALEKRRAGQFRRHTTQYSQIVDPPGHHHANAPATRIPFSNILKDGADTDMVHKLGEIDF